MDRIPNMREVYNKINLEHINIVHYSVYHGEREQHADWDSLLRNLLGFAKWKFPIQEGSSAACLARQSNTVRLVTFGS